MAIKASMFVNRIKPKLTNLIDILFISKYIVQFHKRSPRTKGWYLLGPGVFHEDFNMRMNIRCFRHT